MAKILVVTNEGELIEEITCDEYNLDKALARSFFMDEVFSAVRRAKQEERKEIGE